MAGLIVVCARDRGVPRSAVDDVRRCAELVAPDNIRPNAADLLDADGLVRAVVNPVPGVRADASGACVGVLFEDGAWSTPDTPAPDGTFALVRHDERRLELVADDFATRTIWYVHTPEMFYASTSQRALVALLGSYELCPEAATWMVAAGHIGPQTAWDARLRRVPSAGRVSLDRTTWELSSASDRRSIEPRPAPAAHHLTRLREAVFAACGRLDTEGSPSALTLSGGHDSRSLLVGLAQARKRVRCVTWGLAASLDDPRNDAAIARRLAERFGMPFEYLTLDPGDRPVRAGFTRFLEAGEGRIEDYSGYTDGFDAWKRLFESGLATVIRGDSPGWGFPFPPVNDVVTRSIVHEMTLVSDYPEGDLIHELGLAPQHPPDGLFSREDETLDRYRDRIYSEYELPACMAAFNVVKCAYLEIVNPLLAREVTTAAAELPDELRHMRHAFERVVGEFVPDIPFAESGADEALARYLGRQEVVAELLAELSSADARRVFSAAALERTVADLERPLSKARTRLRERVRAVLPERAIRAVRPVPRPHVSTRELAWRMYIASRMAAILTDDARALRR